MKDYSNLSKEEVLALTPEQLNRMTLGELRAVALNFVKWLPSEDIKELLIDRHDT